MVNTIVEGDVTDATQDVAEASSSDDEFVYALAHGGDKMPLVDVVLTLPNDGDSISIKPNPDSGATVDVLHEDDLLQFKSTPKLEASHKVVYAFGQEDPIDIVGQVTLKVTWRGKSVISSFQVVKGKRVRTVLCYQTCVKLGILNEINQLPEEEATPEY